MLFWKTLGPGIQVDAILHVLPIRTPLQNVHHLMAVATPSRTMCLNTEAQLLRNGPENEMKSSTWPDQTVQIPI